MNRTPAWARWTALSVMVCLGLPAAAVLGEHQLPGQPLVEWMGS